MTLELHLALCVPGCQEADNSLAMLWEVIEESSQDTLAKGLGVTPLPSRVGQQAFMKDNLHTIASALIQFELESREKQWISEKEGSKTNKKFKEHFCDAFGPLST